MNLKEIPKEVTDILPRNMLQVIEGVETKNQVEEIRIRLDKNIHIVCSSEDFLILYKVTKSDIEGILNLATNYSFYANEESLLKGFITLKGGHRIGFSGSVIKENDKIISIRNINSLNIRIAREIVGVSRFVMPYILNKDKILNTLIVSPPKVGKTTLLRDISREISTNKEGYIGKRVCIVDERKEIAALHNGISRLDVGQKSDVLEGIDKAYGMNMLIRAMSPQVIITDEVGKIEDISSLENCVLSGVNVISSAHGESMQDILNRKEFVSIIKKGIFDRYIFLENKKGIRQIKEIYNRSLERII